MDETFSVHADRDTSDHFPCLVYRIEFAKPLSLAFDVLLRLLGARLW